MKKNECKICATPKEIKLTGANYKIRLPYMGKYPGDQDNEWIKLLNSVGESNDTLHWMKVFSWGMEDKNSCGIPTRASRGYDSARLWRCNFASTQIPFLGFRPAFELLGPDAQALPDGTLIEMDTLYMDGEPVDPAAATEYVPGAKLTFAPGPYNVRGYKVGNAVIADRVLLRNISWDDLNREFALIVLDLDLVMSEGKMHFWCNGAGDINILGESPMHCGSLSEMPKAIADLYKRYWSELHGLREYVVTLNGIDGMAIGVLLDRGYIEDICEDHDIVCGDELKNAAASAALEGLVKWLRANIPNVFTILKGEGTDPYGDEIYAFCPGVHCEKSYIKTLQIMDDTVYHIYQELFLDSIRKSTKEHKYVICIDPEWVRDTQICDTTELSDEQFEVVDKRKEELWHDMSAVPFVAVVSACSEEEACKKAAEDHQYDPRCLFAEYTI